VIVETLRVGNSRELLDETDLIIDGTDNFPARSILNRFAIEKNIPHLFTSAIANQGHLSMFNPPATPCLECLMPMTGPAQVDTCETLGVTSTVVGLVGTLAAAEAAKRFLGLPSRILGHLLTIDLAGPDFVFTAIQKREKCGVCNGSPSEPVRPDNVVMLCGDNVANVLPERDLTVDLESLNTKVPQGSVVASSDSVFVYTKQRHRVSVFKTGRLLIGNVHGEEEARQAASEVWNEILE
jgi:adenylyltransferase/sulfurtransferase